MAVRKAAITDHAKRRLRERYGVSLKKKTELILKEGQIIKRKHISNSRSLLTINHNGNIYKAVYSKTSKKIITFLTP